MELPYAAEGIILASDKYREKDRLLIICTKELGKIKVISRGSRKMNSKLSPHLEPLDWVNLMLVNGKSLITLTGSSQINNFKDLKVKGAYTLLALYLMDLVDKTTPENMPEEKIFDLCLDLLEYLNKVGKEEKAKLKIEEINLIFKIRLLDVMGLRPEEISKNPSAFKKTIGKKILLGETINWRPAQISTMVKIVNRSFEDILNRQTVNFSGYIS